MSNGSTTAPRARPLQAHGADTGDDGLAQNGLLSRRVLCIYVFIYIYLHEYEYVYIYIYTHVENTNSFSRSLSLYISIYHASILKQIEYGLYKGYIMVHSKIGLLWTPGWLCIYVYTYIHICLHICIVYMYMYIYTYVFYLFINWTGYKLRNANKQIKHWQREIYT